MYVHMRKPFFPSGSKGDYSHLIENITCKHNEHLISVFIH